MAKLNPVFSGIRVEEGIDTAASVKGIAGKTFLLFGVAVLSAVLSLTVFADFVYGSILGYLLVLLGAVICGIIGQVNPNAAKVCSIIYAVCEGALLGLISVSFEAEVNGIIQTAVLLTGTIFGVMLLLYSTNTLRATARFVRVMCGIGLTLLIVSLVIFISTLINPYNAIIEAFAAYPAIIVAMSLLILVYAAFMLILDFEEVNTIVANGFDKKYEWTAALGLMVTLVWIYLEVLRLLYLLYQLYGRD
jgi:uncharacterized YccA/Bax inhibitor family protein